MHYIIGMINISSCSRSIRRNFVRSISPVSEITPDLFDLFFLNAGDLIAIGQCLTT